MKVREFVLLGLRMCLGTPGHSGNLVKIGKSVVVSEVKFGHFKHKRAS